MQRADYCTVRIRKNNRNIRLAQTGMNLECETLLIYRKLRIDARLAAAGIKPDPFSEGRKVHGIQAMSFDDFAAMILREESTAEGFVINPFGSSLPLKRPLIAYLKDDKEQRYNGGV